MIIQPIVDLVAICARKGVKNVILSPGSRCAPITLAFARHPEMHCRTVSDERSAAFIALGMAQQTQKPVVLVCSSGTASLNYAPAVAEAYFQEIPLIVITADRPTEWIDQWDGQTIRQEKIYGNHIKKDFRFPDAFSHPDQSWHAHRISNEAINIAAAYPAGPVHINIPLREPFYPSATEKFNYSLPLPSVDQVHSGGALTEDQKIQLKNQLERYSRILIVPGQQRPNPKLQQLLDQLMMEQRAVVVTDTISNLQSEHSINYHDQFIPVAEAEKLSPDLIISFGKSIISKSLKLFLRSSGAEHWHIRPNGYIPDTYQGLTKQLFADPASFLTFLGQNISKNDPHFQEYWTQCDQHLADRLKQELSHAEFGEWKAIHQALSLMPGKSKLHLANSMAVRYVNFLGPRPQEVICNRGTSGIDGSNSTAVGCTFTTKEMVTLITGDMAFFYDRNAFWNNYTFNNLRVILLNNHAGGIFRIIDGPAMQPELEEFFETKQALSAENLAREFNFHYKQVTLEEDYLKALDGFFQPSVQPKIIEVITDSKNNTSILKEIKAKLMAGFQNSGQVS